MGGGLKRRRVRGKGLLSSVGPTAGRRGEGEVMHPDGPPVPVCLPVPSFDPLPSAGSTPGSTTWA